MKNKKNIFDKNSYDRIIIKDCGKSLIKPLILNIISDLFVFFAGIFTADFLGNFANSVFDLNVELGFQNIVFMTIGILSSVALGPGLKLLSDFSMLKNSLKHDNLVIGRFLDKDPTYAKSYNTGKLQYQLEDAPNNLRLKWMNVCETLFSVPICLVYILYALIKINWILALTITLLSILKLFFPIAFKKKIAYYDKKRKTYNAEQRSLEHDIVSYIHLEKNWRIDCFLVNNIKTKHDEFFDRDGKKQISNNVFFSYLNEFVNLLCQLVLFILGALLVSKKIVLPGALASIFIYFALFQSLVSKLISLIVDIPILKNHISTVRDFYNNQESTNGIEILDFHFLKGERITFSYPNKNILVDFDFNIKDGEKIGILGANGTGKSTLCKIICLLIKNYRGGVYEKNIEIRQLNLEQWRNLISYVPQVPFLFSGTIQENILFGCDDNEKKDEYSKMMKDFHMEHLQYREISTDLELSGGEKQKISLIREFIRDTKILILDEPSNHLDRNSIEVLKQYLMATKKTTIIISHDNYFKDIMDRIYEF